MPQASYVQGARQDKTRSHGIEHVEYIDDGKRFTNSAAAWRAFVASFDDDDDYERVEVFVPRDVLRRAEAAADQRGTNLGDLIADTLSLGIVAGRGA